MAEQDINGDRLQQQLAVLDLALRPQGILGEIAQEVVSNDHELESDEAADVLFPPRQAGDTYKARWELIEGAADVIKTATKDNSEAIFGLAEQVGMRKSESVSETDLSRINPGLAIWVIEGGANRTSVVRREIALEAMLKIYGDKASSQEVVQLGSDRPIPRVRNEKPNPEYDIAQEIAGDHLPEDDSLTEFDLNVASALQSGYQLDEEEQQLYEGISGVQRVVRLKKPGLPNLLLIKPQELEGGLKDGLSAIRSIDNHFDSIADLERCQFVVATNGQYRPKDELQVKQWAKSQGIEMLPAVALGDEPGYTVEHNGHQITTAERAPTAYVNEMVILRRLTKS